MDGSSRSEDRRNVHGSGRRRALDESFGPGGGVRGGDHGQTPRTEPRTRTSSSFARTRKRAANQTLSVFLSALQGSSCIVELDNETVIRGTLESVDDGMNLMMVGCVSKDVYGRTKECGSLHVRGGSVRFVHLAKGIDPGKAVRDHQRRMEITRREAYTRHQTAAKREKGAS